MKVILTENVDKLGKIGDVVKVKDGFARNFLLPENKAVVYSSDMVMCIEKKKKAEAERYQRDIKQAQDLAQTISALSLTVKAQAGEDDKLYGSITNVDVQAALEAEGVTIDKKKIVISEPIKKLGIYTLTVKLLPEVEAPVKVWVVRQ